MQYPRYPAMAVAVILSLASVFATAASAATLSVRDRQDNPLRDAVILVDGVAQRPPLSTSMDQIDRQFQPHVLVVPAGTRVDFPNSDDVRHHVYSFSPAKRFELRLFQGAEAPPVIFGQAGTVVLGCNIHDAMLGYVLVTDSPWYAATGPDGVIDLAHLPAGEQAVSWWHPSLGDDSPVSLGAVDLHALKSLILDVDAVLKKTVEKPLSPLQMRFNKAAGKHAD